MVCVCFISCVITNENTCGKWDPIAWLCVMEHWCYSLCCKKKSNGQQAGQRATSWPERQQMSQRNETGGQGRWCEGMWRQELPRRRQPAEKDFASKVVNSDSMCASVSGGPLAETFQRTECLCLLCAKVSWKLWSGRIERVWMQRSLEITTGVVGIFLNNNILHLADLALHCNSSITF